MIEKILFKIVNQDIRLTRHNAATVLFKENYNSKLQVGIGKIDFSEDCIDKVLDIASVELITKNQLYRAINFHYVKLPNEYITSLGSLLTNINFNRRDYQIKTTNLSEESVYTYEPKQIDFKDCDFVNKLQCKLILRDIFANVVFTPRFFMVEVVFTNDSASYIDEKI